MSRAAAVKATADAARKRLTRLFPGLGVQVQAGDYDCRIDVSWTAPLSEGPRFAAFGRGGVQGIEGMILRSAYPRGWATP